MISIMDITKRSFGIKVIKDTITEGEKYKNQSSSTNGISDLVMDLVAGTSLRPSDALGGAILGSLNKSEVSSFEESTKARIYNEMG